jgi:hypothetical protein
MKKNNEDKAYTILQLPSTVAIELPTVKFESSLF